MQAGPTYDAGECLPHLVGLRVPRGPLMVKKLIFASKEGKFPRPKAHAASRS
jgi:hypothetical protein